MLTAEADVSRLHLREIIDRLEQPRDLHKVMGDLLADFERKVFATRGHGTWEPDDPVTIAGKGNSRVLHDTGDLLDALTTPRTEGESEVVDQGDAYYAIFHRLGSRGMPRRDPAPEPTDADVEGWANELLAFIVDGGTR